MVRRGLLLVAAAGACLLTSALLAKPGVVKTHEGQVYDGEIEEKDSDDFITVTVHGIATHIARADVETITYGAGPDTEYQQRLAKLDPKDAKGRMDLARWAFSLRRYDLARDAADKALEIDPNSAEATDFLTLVQSQQRMERARARAASGPANEESAGPVATSRGNVPEWHYLSGQDINRIRQEELRKTDTRVRFQFRNDVERRYLSIDREYTLTDWRALPPLARAINILDKGEPNMRDDVVITSDPAAILEFRRLVQPLVVANCATMACHGSASAGPLVLSQAGDANEAATYTNFYILEKYAQKVTEAAAAAGQQQGGIFGNGPVQRQMIDRGHAEDSLLVQYGLPRNAAKFPHPDVLQFRPAFPRGRQDPKYQAIVSWIGSTLAPVEPNYGIDYQPPVGTHPAATGPADKSASTSATTRSVRRR